MALKIDRHDIFDLLRCIIFSLLFSIAFVMIFALIVKFTQIGENIIVPVNIGIKIVSIALGTLCGIKTGRKGMLKGVLNGLVFVLLSYLIFSAINGDFSVNPLTAYDVLFCTVAGLLSGILTVNVRKGKNKD